MLLQQQRPELVERDLTGLKVRLAGPRPVGSRPEEQDLYVIHLHYLGSGTYSGPTMIFKAWGMTSNSAGSSPITSPSAVNSSPPGLVSTRISFALVEKTPSLPR